MTIDGALRIIGEYFQVIRVEGGNANINGGMIIASGVYTIGVEVNNGTVNINGGTVTAEGMDSCGISAADSEVNINGGEITASGDRSYGVTVFYGGNANINGGTITASGDGSYGVAVLLGMAEINGGTITATDEEGYAIYIYNNGCVNITASSGLSIIGGVFYSDGPQLLTNSLPSPINVNLCEVEQTSFEFNPCVEFEIYEDEPSSELNASYNGNTVTLIPQKVGLFNLVLIPKDGYNLKIIIPVSVIVCDGEGTSDSPFLISNAAHLIAISKYDDLWSKHFRQTADISLEGVDWTPIGNYENIQFTGTYDGNGKTISNLTIVYDGWDVGLFGDIGTGAVVKNITLVDVSISSGMDLAYVGALVGGNNGGEIINCSVIGGSVEFSGYGGSVGGLVGCNEGNEGNEGSISGCKSDVVVVNTGEENKIGGLVGFNYEYATIEDCESSGNATGGADSYVGGLVGNNYYGAITDCVSSGYAIGGESSCVGALVGYDYVVSLQLTGISFDASAAKKVYWVGDSLDVRGLKVIGHYTGNNSAVLSVTVTTNDVTGFDSSRPAASKTLTVTLFEFTATYSIAINVPPSDDTPAPTTTPAPGTIQVDYTVTNGTATLQLPTSKINEIIEKSDGKVAVIDLSGDSRVASAQFPTNVLTSLKDAGLDMSVKLPSGTITLDSEVAASIASQAEGNNIRVELAQTSPETLTSEQRETVGSGDIVLDINISSGNRKISTFDGTLTIQIPYDGPLPVAVWYLNDAGELERLNCTYKDGAVIFTLDHLSLYVVGQDNKWQNPFTDVKEGSWYYTAVGFIAETTTRAEMAQVLYNLLGR